MVEHNGLIKEIVDAAHHEVANGTPGPMDRLIVVMTAYHREGTNNQSEVIKLLKQRNGNNHTDRKFKDKVYASAPPITVTAALTTIAWTILLKFFGG